MRRTLKNSPPPLGEGQGEGELTCTAPSPYPSPKGRGELLLIVLLASTISSCATFPGKQSTKTSTTKTGTVTTVKPPDAPPREVMKPTTTDYAAVQSPKRQVSQQLVGQAKVFLDNKDYDRARQRLEDAVTIDPTNGSAYYHLAVVYYNLHDTPKALGFLDQAESLFHSSPEWVETIQKFRELMR